jgi:hypothetical protein
LDLLPEKVSDGSPRVVVSQAGMICRWRCHLPEVDGEHWVSLGGARQFCGSVCLVEELQIAESLRLILGINGNWGRMKMFPLCQMEILLTRKTNRAGTGLFGGMH